MSNKEVFTAKEVIEARNALWKKGNLEFKLYPEQKLIYKEIKANPDKIVVMNASRRWGKTTIMLILAVEQCIKKPGSVVKFVAPSAKQIRTVLRSNMRQVLAGCPVDLRPEYKTMDHIYKFPNDSEIQLAGTDKGHADSLRGGSADLCIVDEAGFVDDLRIVVTEVLLPTTTTTKGKLIMASTPSNTQDHDFIRYVQRAEENGTLIKKTIYDNPTVSADEIIAIATELGGVDSIAFRREYMAEIITNQDYAIVPEFTKEVQSECIKDWNRPPFYDCYTAMDIGFRDLTVALFAYYDFKNSKLIIEDELVMNGKTMTTDALAIGVKEKEKFIWCNPITGDIKKPTLRISDNNLNLINDLQVLHGLTFLPTAKDNAEAALNHMRMLVAQKRIVINPRCKNLISHLRNGMWTKARTTYERADGHHYDAIDALKYLIRNVNFYKNPYPANYDMGSSDDMFTRTKTHEERNLEKNIKNIFSPKKRRY